MKIESATVQLTSQHNRVDYHAVKESLQMWSGRQNNTSQPRGALPETTTTLSPQAKAKETENNGDISSDDPKLQAMIHLIEMLTGKKVKVLNLENIGEEPKINTAAPTQNSMQNWGLIYDRQETIYQAEQTHFSAQGIVKTADGKEIQFNLELSMQREYFEQTNIAIRMGEAAQQKDPLVINFNGTAAQLTDTKFKFDLEGKGETNLISFVTSGSGFLALDKNNNGVIDNGTELFGVQSGNGFADLAAYDNDRNGWIDENDAIYQQLKIWSKDAQGNDYLNRLADHNIGAIYLGNVTTPFDLNNANNVQHGQVRSSGIYLTETGNIGTVQQIDLVV